MTKEFEKTIMFVCDVDVVDHTGAVTFSARAGDTKSLPVASANRWLRRQMATLGKIGAITLPAAQQDVDESKEAEAVEPKPAKKKAPKKKQAD